MVRALEFNALIQKSLQILLFRTAIAKAKEMFSHCVSKGASEGKNDIVISFTYLVNPGCRSLAAC